jgi:hypothetical protein
MRPLARSELNGGTNVPVQIGKFETPDALDRAHFSSNVKPM